MVLIRLVFNFHYRLLNGDLGWLPSLEFRFVDRFENSID
jgi:hypothetical protein